jgi:hypothetical protein
MKRSLLKISVADRISPVLEEVNPESKRLYILFGGIAAALGMPPFEFYNSSRILKDNKIFLRDLAQSWYQRGLPGIGKSAYDVAQYLKKKIKNYEPDQIYFVGNSMGGYAAILFASLLKKGTVIAFCPQTFISPTKKIKYRDFRWSRAIIKTYMATMLQYPRPIYDVKKVLSGNGSGCIVRVFVSRNDKLDLAHAARIQKLENVSVFKYDVAGHNLVKILREKDQLKTIMEGKDASCFGVHLSG